jgi:hypothetical protein
MSIGRIEIEFAFYRENESETKSIQVVIKQYQILQNVG